MAVVLGEAAGAVASAARLVAGQHAASAQAAVAGAAEGTEASAAVGAAVAGEPPRVVEASLQGRQGTASAVRRRAEAGTWPSRCSRLRRCGP